VTYVKLVVDMELLILHVDATLATDEKYNDGHSTGHMWIDKRSM